MADVRPFRGWRYNLARVGELSAVVAPPYDVIDSELEQQLHRRHPANIVRIELGKEPPGGPRPDDRYGQASRQLQEWKIDGTLMQDSTPAIYLVHQQFEVDGRSYTRRGFLARLKLEPFGAGAVYPHEETMPGPKADRLKLYHATGMNVSPIFGLYPDATNEVQDLLESAARNMTALQAVDHLGVVSRMWPLTDQQLVSKVRGLMGRRPVFIADGHHRYETALRYLDDRRAAGAVRDDDAPANFCLMMCVGMSDPGLKILPTHRLVTGATGLDSTRLRSLIAQEFEVDEIGDAADGCRAAWELIESDSAQSVLGLGTAADGKWSIARLKNTATLDRLVPDHSPTWRELGVSILHELLLGHLLSNQFNNAPQLRYVHLVSEVNDLASKQPWDLACLVPAATMDHVQQIASSGERMPAKSTYFYPKLLTGLVLNPIS